MPIGDCLNGSIPVIINASAHSDGAAEVSTALARHFAAVGVRVETILAKSGAEIIEGVRTAILARHRTIVVGGGDGTLNAAATLLVGSEIALGVLPLGTLNHFARDLHIPLDIDKAVETIAVGHCAQIDIGAVNGRYFLNNASLGIYPRLVERRDQQQQWLGRGKWPAFALAVLGLLRRYPFMEVILEVEGKSLARHTPFVFVGNNRYEMEGLRIGERARIDDGELSLYVANHTGRLGLIRLALRALFHRLNQAADFDTLCARHIVVKTGRARVHLATDGELIIAEPPLNFSVLARALKVVVPRPDPVASG